MLQLPGVERPAAHQEIAAAGDQEPDDRGDPVADVVGQPASDDRADRDHQGQADEQQAAPDLGQAEEGVGVERDLHHADDQSRAHQEVGDVGGGEGRPLEEAPAG